MNELTHSVIETLREFRRVETTSRTSSPQKNHGGEISHYGAAFSKARKQLEMGRLATVQKAGTQNVIGLVRLGPLVLCKGSGGGCIP
jgi:hypothetical protein